MSKREYITKDIMSDLSVKGTLAKQYNRKIFNYKNWREWKLTTENNKNVFTHPISAAGILFKNKNRILLYKTTDNNIYDDLGGKVDVDDNSPYGTILREVIEETNGVINYIDFKKVKWFYNRNLKYLHCITDVDCEFGDVFGDTEIFNGKRRTINWYNISDVIDNLNWRLRSKYFLNYLSKSKND